ncbi:MAG: family 1 encapsulin nanocompartment shell protein [Anaerolineae bacterium]|jgi:uncharacterized linocin/CFP29 family protein|nr:bacteriocin family protein [Chloroflexota bacterium]
MSDYLMRDQAPLGVEVWKAIDGMVAEVITKTVVGRRLLKVVGPLGWGVEQAPVPGFEKVGEAWVTGEAPTFVPLQTATAGFMLRMKDLARADQTPFALDLGAVATAAVELARKEDGIVLQALLDSAAKGAMGDWTTINGPFSAIANAEADLRARGFDGPYALVVNYGTYAQLASLMSEGQRELKLVEHLVEDGIFRSSLVPEGKALLVDPAGWNADIVLGQDVATAFLGNDGLNLVFQVIETLAVRVKRAGSAVLLS